MTDKEILFSYRLQQAEETLSDARKMLENNLSPRSIINRAYYSMFYVLLAIFIKTDINIKTSKHSGIISFFDKEFIHTGKIEKRFSKMLHKMFKARQESDYKEFVELTEKDATDSVKLAGEFIKNIKKIMSNV
ncbi:MAG: HEPN domain-containing protein [bacterium]